MNVCRYNGPCDYRCSEKPHKTDKEKLINGLHRQIEILESNAAYLHKLYPGFTFHNKLMGVVEMTQNWLDNIET